MDRDTSDRGIDHDAAANFLASLGDLTYQEAVANCEADKASYGWSHETSGAIREGIAKHFASLRLPREPRQPRLCLVPPTNSAVPPHSASPLSAGNSAPGVVAPPRPSGLHELRKSIYLLEAGRAAMVEEQLETGRNGTNEVVTGAWFIVGDALKLLRDELALRSES